VNGPDFGIRPRVYGRRSACGCASLADAGLSRWREDGRVTTVVDTPRGPARVHADDPAGEPRGLLVLGHGAGGGITAPDLVAVTEQAVRLGLAVRRVEQPYRVAGRRAPAPANQLDEAWQAVLAELTGAGLPLLVGGRSSGARVACRWAAAGGAAPRPAGVVCLAFPVHPPGRPDRSRLAELDAVTVPVLVVQGDRDPFGMPPPRPGRTVLVVPGADHGLRRGLAGVREAFAGWLSELGLTGG
jgi:predicted alpha/beta-hydrolase family hydrolase